MDMNVKIEGDRFPAQFDPKILKMIHNVWTFLKRGLSLVFGFAGPRHSEAAFGTAC